MSLPAAAVLTAAPTPFDSRYRLDLGRYRALLAIQREAGIDGVFCAGSTAEFTALDRPERRALVEVALDVFGAERVVAHIGASAAHPACALADDALAAGARRLAAVSPFYLVDQPGGVHAYYRELDRHLGGRAELWVYLYRPHTGYRLAPSELGELAALPSITGAKISGESAGLIGEYVRATPSGFTVFTGNDAEFAASVRLGAAGVASGACSIVPELFVDLAAALRAGDAAEVERGEWEVREVARIFDGVPSIKAGLAELGRCTAGYRVALDPPSPGRLDELRARLAVPGESRG